MSTTPHSLSTSSAFITSIGPIFSSTLVTLRNELASSGVHITPVRLSTLSSVGILNVLVPTTTSTSTPSTTVTGNASTTLALSLRLLLLLLGLLLSERVLLLATTPATTASASAPSNRETGLERSQNARSSIVLITLWWLIGQILLLLVLNLTEWVWGGSCLRDC